MNEEIAKMMEDLRQRLKDRAGRQAERLTQAEAALRFMPVTRLSEEEQVQVTRMLNLLRVLETGDVVSLIVSIEHVLDGKNLRQAVTLVGNPRRLSFLKMILDQAYFKMMGESLDTMMKG